MVAIFVRLSRFDRVAARREPRSCRTNSAVSYRDLWSCGLSTNLNLPVHITSRKESFFMWKPTNPPTTTPTPSPEPQRSYTPPVAEPPVVTRPAAATPQEQATLGKSLVIKGEVTGSE